MVVLYKVIYWEIDLLENCREVLGEGTSWYLWTCGQIEVPKQKLMNRLHLLSVFNWPSKWTDSKPRWDVFGNICVSAFNRATWWQQTWWHEPVLWLRLDSNSSDLLPFPPRGDLSLSALNSCRLPLTHQCLSQEKNFYCKLREASESSGAWQIFAL